MSSPSPFPAPQPGMPASGDFQQLSQASNAFNLGLGGLIVALCCCGPAGLIMGIIAMNNANGVLATAQVGGAAHSKASTAKILGIVAIALGAFTTLAQIGGGILNVVGNMR